VKRKRNKEADIEQKEVTQFRIVRSTEENEHLPSIIRFTNRQMFVSLIGFSFIVFILSFLLISHTSLREYIPGVPSSKIKKELIAINQQLDSIGDLSLKNETYYRNISMILNNQDTILPIIGKDELKKNETPELTKTAKNIDFINKIENREKFNTIEVTTEEESLKSRVFFTPIQGLITDKFNLKEKHFGVDLVANTNEPIKAVLNGTVIFADWTSDNGHIIAIQHKDDLISVYKHNSALLKKVGDYVRYGEVISIIGNTGKLSHGPHLHFELWYNGYPLDPEEAILF